MSQTEVQLIKNSAVVTADIADSTGASDGVTTAKIATSAITTAKIADQAVDLSKLPHGTSSNNGKFLRANNGADPSFETVTTTTINSNADNRIITGSGTADTLNAESEFTFDGSNILCRAGEGGNASLNLIADQGDDNGDGWKIQSEQDENDLTFKSNISGSYVDKLKLKSSGQLECQGNLEVSGTITPTGNVVIPDTIVHTGDTNTKIRFPAADTVTVETGGSERARIDSQGRFLINTTSYKSNLNASADSSGQIAQFVHAGDNINGCLSVFAYSGGTSPTTRGAKLQLHRARSSDGSTNTILSNGDLIGSIEFKGNDGANFTAAGRIDVMVDGGTGADDMPGRIQFLTSADGSGAPTEHMRIHSGGQVSMGKNSTYTSVNHDYQLVVTPNITDSSLGALGLLIDGEHGTSGGASVDSISLKVKNTNTWNNATHQYGGYFEVNQQLLQPQTGVYSQATGLYNVQKCFSAQLNKNINAVTTGISYYSNIVETGSGGAAYHAQFFDNGTEKLQIRLGGNILNANNTYGSLSDVKLKENIVDANSQWDDIKGLKIRNFNFKNDPDKVKMLGVIAQEAETVSAGLIETNDDKLKLMMKLEKELKLVQPNMLNILFFT